MASSPIIVNTPDNEVPNFKQREGENLKDAWYRICNAQNRSTRKKSTSVLLRNFYVGISPWNRYVLDIDCNPSCPILLGRPFLRTIGAIIDMKEGNIRFQFPLRKAWNTSLEIKLNYHMNLL